jgi:hypothetical protein
MGYELGFPMPSQSPLQGRPRTLSFALLLCDLSVNMVLSLLEKNIQVLLLFQLFICVGLEKFLHTLQSKQQTKCRNRYSKSAVFCEGLH